MGDSDVFALEMPGTLSSKKSSDSLHMVDSMIGVNPLEEYEDSPLDKRRRGNGERNEHRLGSGSSPGYRSVEFGGRSRDYDSPVHELDVDDDTRPRRGLSALGEAASSSSTSMEYFDDRTLVADFLRQYHCTSMMPQSSKVVVLDAAISIRAAFHALEENDIDSAPLWDSNEHDFNGVITIGDLLAVLMNEVPDLERVDVSHVLRKIETTSLNSQVLEKQSNRELVFLEPSDTLFEAVSMLSRFKVHRLPVIDRLEQNTILYVLTASKIVVFLMKIMAKRPALFETSLEKIQIGHLAALTTASVSSTLYEVLKLVETTHFSAIPIVDDHGVLIDTLYKNDFARVPPNDILASLSSPAAQVLQNWRERNLLRSILVNTCTVQDTMEVVLTRLMDSRLRSLVIVDSARKVQGIVALTDVLRCFLV